MELAFVTFVQAVAACGGNGTPNNDASDIQPVDTGGDVISNDATAMDADASVADAADAIDGADATDAADVVGDEGSMPSEAPRPIAPLSTSTVTSRRPTLKWALVTGTDGAHVELCSDRACAHPIGSFDAMSTSGHPMMDLPTGIVYWRLHAIRAGMATTDVSPTWEFTVGAQTAPVDTSWGTLSDFNGDGLSDLIIGANIVNSHTGSAYVYLAASGGLSTTPATTLTGPGGMGGDFGVSVASAGDLNGDGYADAVVGADTDTNGGRVFIYYGSATGISSTADITLNAPGGTGSHFGLSVAGAGDVNGDGYADLLVGAPGSAHAGQTFVYHGSAMGVGSMPDVTITGPDGTSGAFGGAVATAGDINGDGFADIVVGANNAMSGIGRAHVFVGSATSINMTPVASYTGPDGAGGHYGNAVATAGDLNGDGLTEVMVAAWDGMDFTGTVSIYLGNATSLNTTADISLVGLGGINGHFGSSIASAGDVDGDGLGDIVIGAWDAMGFIGTAYVFVGTSTGLNSTPVTSLVGPDGASGFFGGSVVSPGDIDGDGRPDIAISAVGVMSGAGRVYVFANSASGIGTTAATTLTGPDGAGGHFGASVALAPQSARGTFARCVGSSALGERVTGIARFARHVAHD